MSLLGSWKSDERDRVRLHGGKLVLYRRPEYASARWQDRLALPSGGYQPVDELAFQPKWSGSMLRAMAAV